MQNADTLCLSFEGGGQGAREMEGNSLCEQRCHFSVVRQCLRFSDFNWLDVMWEIKTLASLYIVIFIVLLVY